jgi:hypothetical protein
MRLRKCNFWDCILGLTAAILSTPKLSKVFKKLLLFSLLKFLQLCAHVRQLFSVLEPVSLLTSNVLARFAVIRAESCPRRELYPEFIDSIK